MSSRSLARWTSSSARSTDERAARRYKIRATRELRFYPRKPRTGARAHRQISFWTAGERRPAIIGFGATPARWVAAAGGNGSCRRDARDGADPGLRGRNFLYDVQSAAGRTLFAAGLHDDAVLAARFGRTGPRLSEQAPYRRWRHHAGRALHFGRGGMPGRLRQRADPASQRRFLRGSRRAGDGSTARRAARRESAPARFA